MNKFNHFIGIDVSKLTLDVCVLSTEKTVYFKIDNTLKGLKSLKRELKKQKIDLKASLFCSENTGIYNSILQDFCLDNDFFYWEESAMQIKRSMGFVRGKNDKIDAYRIAIYSKRHQENFEQFIPLAPEIKQLKRLVNLRQVLLKSKTQIKQSYKEDNFIGKEEVKLLKKHASKSINALDTSIKECETKMVVIIRSSANLLRLYKIILSVEGIGQQTAIHTLIATNGFEKFETPKQFACYIGVVPFEYHSGTSIHYRSRVSPMANKQLKTLFHMCSISVIRVKGELQDYYTRKVEEGKHKMSVINAIRNKIIQRMYACVKNDRLYQKRLVNP